MSPANRQIKQSPAKKPTPSAKPRRKLRLFLIIVLLAFVATGSALLYNHHQQQQAINKERVQFAQTEKDLDALTASITANFSLPTDKVRERSCQHASNFSEIGKGDLYCSATDELTYPSENENNAFLFAQSISAKIRLQAKGFNKSVDAANTPKDLLSRSYTNQAGLDCSISFVYFPANLDPSLFGYVKLNAIPQINTLLISSNCLLRPAKAAYYPLKD